MATNYTSLLGFALPTTGELDGTWGTVVNNSITQLVEDSVAGAATQSVAGGDWTLTTTGSGAANQARCAILIPTGSPGVSRNIIAPSQSKAYIVINQSNAAVVLKGAATTGVTIAAGSKSLVAWNGSDFVEVGQAGDVDGPSSSTDNAVARFDGTSGKIIQNSAVTIADTTGDITGGKYNGLTVSTTTGTFTLTNAKTLAVQNTLTLAGTDSTTMTFPSTSTTVAGLGIAQTFTQDQTIAGNLTMNAQGDVRFADADSSNWVAFQGPATVASNVTWTLPNADGSNGQVLTTNGSGTLSWVTNSGGDVTGPASATDNAVVRFDGTTGKLVQNSAVTIADTTGDITTSGYVFTALGAAANPSYSFSGDPNTGVFSSGADTVNIGTGGAERMRIDSAGNVGIGGTAAAYVKQHLLGTYPSSSNITQAIRASGTIPSTSTTSATIFQSIPTTQAASFTCANLYHFGATQQTFGAGSSVTTQAGFVADSTLTGATNNYGFYSNIASGTGRWNFYANGTANNYFAGNVGIATTSPGSALDVKGTLRLSGSSSGYVGLAPAAAAGSTTYTLPSADGTSGQVLSTNGSGTLSWATAGGSTPLSSATTTTVAAAATTTINCALGSVFNITWGASITTLSFTNVPASPQATQLVLVFKKDTSANQYSIVWPASIAWQNNTPPSTNVNPNSVITVTLTTINGGTNWRGSFQTIEGYAGALWGWGENTKYVLGDGTPTDKSSPVQIGSLATWISIGSFQEDGGSFAITNDGVIHGAGTQSANQFGLNKSATLTIFIKMTPVASGLRATAISGASTSQLAIDLEGKLWGWGNGNTLGINTTGESISTPMVVNSGTWIDISNGGENGFALRSDGTIWATGRNAEGQLGQGNTTALSYWVQVGSGTTWSSIATSTDTQAHVLALKTDGTLWAWGYNAQGQLGLGNVTNRSSPVQIGTATDWVQISASYLQSAAIKSNGTLWTWGYNISGQLGVGDTTDRSSPTQVGALTNWKQVCVGYLGMYAIKTDGTLWSWGDGISGALGDGTTVSKSSPIQVGAATDWLWLPKRSSGYFIHCIRGTATNP